MTAIAQSPFNKQRDDKFIMVIPTPKGLKPIQGSTHTNITVIPASLSMSVYGAIVPDVSVPAIALRYAGQTLNTSSMVRDAYPSQSVNFTIDNRFNNYWFIYKWLNLLNNDKTSTYDKENITNAYHLTEKSMQQYFTDISIYALDEYEKRVMEFKFTQAFPTKLSGISFNYRQGKEVECTLDFAYSQFLASLVETVDNL
jgi:hypothetical protein